jgi:putative DNA primase/helicase
MSASSDDSYKPAAGATSRKSPGWWQRRAGTRPTEIQPRDQERELEAPGPDERAGLSEGTGPEIIIRPPVIATGNHSAMTTAGDRTYLAVPYGEKDDVKALGAKWDPEGKAWFVPAGMALDAFQPWFPAKGQVCIAVDSDPRAEFARALRACGLQIDGSPEMDGQIHRVAVEGGRGRARSGAYIGYLDGRPAGHIQNFRTGIKTDWKASGQIAPLNAQDRAQMAAEVARQRHDRAVERERQYERTAQEVEAIWAAAAPVDAHPYLSAKDVPSHGLRQAADGRLLVPVRDTDGKIWTLQHIGAGGLKLFHEDGRVEGGHYVIGDLDRPGPLLIAEGYATAATVHELTGLPAIAAFNAGNLAAVAQAYRARHADRPVYIAGDNDHRRETEGKPNVGREKAEQAAALISGFALLPAFQEQDAGSDWNDLVRGEGRDSARHQILAAIAVAEREQIEQVLTTDRDREEDRAPSHAVGFGHQARTAGADLER